MKASQLAAARGPALTRLSVRLQFVSVTSFKMDTARALRMDTRRGDAPVYAYFYEYPLDGTCELDVAG